MMKVAAVQMDIALADVAGNLRRIEERMRVAHREGAELIVFPESCVAGYCFASREEAWPYAQTADGPEWEPLERYCREHALTIVLGFLEQSGQQLFNSAICFGPTGRLGVYRKLHLPALGVDRHTCSGDALPVFQAGACRLGINICYDCAFPEAMRVLMLAGVDVVALPTNWPVSSGRTADLIPAARALENTIYLVVANRVGLERGFPFVGKSQICSPRGEILAMANHDREEIIHASIDLELARKKLLTPIPGLHETHRIRDRRPELYRSLVQPLLPD